MSNSVLAFDLNALLGVVFDTPSLVPTMWGIDPPKPPKDFLWCTSGWENDCLHVKLLNATPTFYSDDSRVGQPRLWIATDYGSWVRDKEWKVEVSADVITITAGSIWWKRYPFAGNSSDDVFQFILRDPILSGNKRSVQVHYVRKRWRPGSGDWPVHRTIWDVTEMPTPDVSSGSLSLGLTEVYGHWAVPHLNLGECVLLDENNYQERAVKEYRNTAHGIYITQTSQIPDELARSCSKAYYAALQDCVAKLNDNNIQNIASLAMVVFGLCVMPAMKPGRSIVNRIADGICDFVNKGEGSTKRRVVRNTVKAAVKLWLPYRYVYSTTVSDVNEAEHYLQAVIDEQCGYPDEYRRAYGSSNFTAKNGTQVRVRCRLNWLPNQLTEGLSKWNELWKLGLEPNPYVLWDMIPFSFVVDWFTDVGDYASVLSDAPHYEALISVRGICFSTKYIWEPEPNIKVQVYRRWQSFVAPDLLKSVGGDQTSRTTLLRRFNDFVALVTPT